MRALIAISCNTFREARREKVVILAAAIALMLVAAANYFLKIDLGHERLKFVFDFSNGALGFFGGIIAIVLSCRMFHSELENRTVITLLSKPVGGAHFVFGKFFGVCAALAVFCALVSVAGGLMLLYTQSTLPKNAVFAAPQINYGGFFAYCFLQWGKLCTIAAISTFICALSTSMMFSTIVSFMILAASLMASATVWLGAEGLMTRAVCYVFPDLQVFTAADSFAFARIDWIVFGIIAFYASVYSAVCCALGAWAFSGREF